MLGAAEFATQVRACLDLLPDDARLRPMWADCLQLGDDLAGAADVLAAMLGDEPGNAAVQHRLGMVRAELGDFDTAIAHMVRAVALDPEPALGWANLGMLLTVQGRFEESLDAYGEALLRARCDARIRVNRVVALLHAGRFAEAWRDHAWRLALVECPRLPRARLLPALATLPDLAGRTVLLTHEGGFGDTLQFCRHIPLLAARGARVGLAIPRVLHRLLEGLPSVVAVVEPDGELPAYD
jgi:tetratricopeptide (TPR) repeat protein